jgi:RNA polymerase sigma-70 factor (ECF subfamily)
MSSHDDIEPEHLLAMVRAGDEAQLGPLLEVYRHYVALLVRLQLGKRLQAKLDVEDVVQETFLEVHRAIGRFRGDSTQEFLAWLRQIVSAVLSNQLRRFYGTKRRDVRLEKALSDDIDRSSRHLELGLVAPGSSPSHQASRRETAVRLADALESLPRDYREVIILRQLEDLPFPEVSRRMGRSLDSVKNLWVRALVRLRRGMDDEP